MDRSRVALGRWGEERVARRYADLGYRVLDRNWRGEGGELDLVVGRGAEIVFCEVKTRSSTRVGHPLEAVGPAKQARIRRAAAAWLRHRGGRGRVRFDVASVLAGRVEIVEGAF